MTKETIQKAILGMMSKVKRVPRGNFHSYHRASDNKLLAGVSTVASLVGKDFLVSWGAKEAVKALGYYDKIADEEQKDEQIFLESQLNKIKEMEPKAFFRMLQEAKGAHARKSGKAKDIGTEGHAWCEMYVKAKIRGTELPEMPKGDLERPLKAFVEWEKEHVKEWVASEALVASPDEHEFAGTLDGIAFMKDGGKLALVDFKFSNRISNDYFLQTAGYVLPFEEYGIKFDQRIIVRMPKTEWLPEYDRKTRSYFKVPNNFEAPVVDTDYDFDKRTFLALREAYKWVNFLKKQGK